ncbi:MAG: hypothetical protein AAGU27_12955 [Dehalobacterium sp.]
MAISKDVQSDLLFIIIISLVFIFATGLARPSEAQPTEVPLIYL